MRGKLLLFSIFLVSVCNAQTDSVAPYRLVSDVTDSIKIKKPTHYAFFIQPEGYGAYLFNTPSMLAGLGGNLLINHKIYVGARYNLLTTPVNIIKLLPLINKRGNVGASSQSASINVGYLAWSQKRFSFNPEISIGWTDARFTDPSDNNKRQIFNYAIVIPSLNAVWNAHKNIRLGAGIGARAVFGENYYRLKSYRVGGVFGGIILRVGRF